MMTSVIKVVVRLDVLEVTQTEVAIRDKVDIVGVPFT